MHALGLRLRRPRQRVILRRRLAVCASALLTISSMTMPFSACMQMSAPFSPASRMALKIVPSSTSKHAGIGHEQLEAGDALVDQRLHLGERARRAGRCRSGGSRSRSRSCPRPWRARRRAPDAATALRLHGEVDDAWSCRHTPPRACRSRKSSDAVVPPNGRSMCVCGSMPPGMTSLPVASMSLSASIVEVLADQGDRAAVDEDVGDVVVDGGNDAAVLDQYAHFVLPVAV